MTCAESEVLLHALLDGELDAGHAREVETHLETCPRCARQLVAYRELQQAMPAAQLRFTAPMSLRRRIETALPAARPRTSSRLLCGSMPTKSRMRSVGIEPLAGPSAQPGYQSSVKLAPMIQRMAGLRSGIERPRKEADGMTDVCAVPRDRKVGRVMDLFFRWLRSGGDALGRGGTLSCQSAPRSPRRSRDN